MQLTGDNGWDGDVEALFASINHSPLATVITDHRVPDYPIAAVNPAFTELTGYQPEEIIGRNCRFLNGSETDDGARTILRNAVMRGEKAAVELVNHRKDGSRFRNAVMIAPLLDEQGKVAFYVGSQMDLGDVPASLGARRDAAAAQVAGLTERQRRVLELMSAGYRNKQIAGMLGIDETTVKMHRARLLQRLGVTTSADAIRIGVEAAL